jgi:hypothetical protein
LSASTTNSELNSSSAVPKVTSGISKMSFGKGPVRLFPL